jgi:hypothetical protein
MREKFFIDGVEVNEPLNYQGIEIQLNWDKDSNSQAVSVSELEFGVSDGRTEADSYKILKTKMSRGLSGGTGVTEGVPFKIILDSERGRQSEIFNGYINLWKSKNRNGVISAPIIESGSLDWLNDIAEAVTFDMLDDLGLIDSSLYVEIPYCIEKKQNAFEVIICVVSLFVIADSLATQIQILSKNVADTAGVFTTASGVIGLIAQSIYIVGLVVALAGLLLSLYRLIIQPVKYHYGMYVKDLFDIATRYLGYTFTSSILQTQPFDGLILLPEKYNIQNGNYLEGLLKPSVNESKGYYKGTFADLIRSFKVMFDAKIVIDSGVFYFEKRNFRLSNDGLKLPDMYDSRYEFEFNHEDFNSNTIVSFMTDFSDRHTVKEYAGTSCQAIQTPKVVINSQMRLTKGLSENRIPFALGKRKTKYSDIENLLNGAIAGVNSSLNLIIEALNAVIDTANDVIDSLNDLITGLEFIGINLDIDIETLDSIDSDSIQIPFDNKIGLLKMESDYVNVPKLLMLDGRKLLGDDYLNAKYIFDNFHIYKLFVEYNGNVPNQYLIKSIDEMPFTYTDYETVKNNNAIFTAQGETGELISLKFNPYKQTASLQYRVLKQYTDNLQLQILEPDGL